MMPSCGFTSTIPPEKGKQLSPSLNGTDAIWLTDLQIATGAFMFTADLVRYISEPHLVDFVRIQSYGNSTVSSGVATISTDCKLDLKDKHVIVVRVIPLHVLEQVFWGNFVWNLVISL
jgi:hypoxanthine phosphoribosyltransferase